MSKLAKYILILLATTLVSGPAFAAINFSDDFESYPIFEGDASDLGGGWLLFANVFTDYPGCSTYLYDYGGVYPAPNGPFISNIVEGSTGRALNKFSDYNNGDHGGGLCIETNVFQERTLLSTDLGDYAFTFDTEVPGALGTGVNTFGFVKLLDPNNDYNLDLYIKVSTVTAGAKFINVTLDETAEGKILQWGFTDTASNYQDSGRWYDNVEFSLGTVIPPKGPDTRGVPIPLWAFLGMAGLIALVGGSKLRSRRKA